MDTTINQRGEPVVGQTIDEDGVAEAASPGDAAWAAQSGPMKGRKKRAYVASFWVIATIGTNQFTRLISNLVLTRLLFPEAFGLMAFVTVVMNVLQMFSDLGIDISVLRSKGANAHFINCAWTIRLIRGFLIWLVALLLAYPVALFYDQPMLAAMIPATATLAIIQSLGSPALWLLNRRLNLWPTFWRSCFADVSGLLLKINLAIYFQSAWVLVAGVLFTDVLKVMTSYWIMKDIRPRLVWDREVFRQINSFGKWLFFGSILTFVLQQGDKAVLGKMVSAEMLGIYVIAMLLPRAVIDLMIRLNKQILLPLYSDLVHHAAKRLRQRVFTSRIALLCLGIIPACLMAVFGQHLIDLLYDPRYASAGWMLQILSVGVVAVVINMTTAAIALPAGDSYAHFINQVVKGSTFMVAMAIGGWFYGMAGLIVGCTISHYLVYPSAAWVARRHDIWHYKLDGIAFVLAASFIAVGWWRVGLPSIFLPGAS